jgi:hypothetical protein
MNPNFSTYTGIGHGIDYEHMSLEWDEETCRRYCFRMKEQYAKLSKAWSDDLNSEWLTRNYLAVKRILAATVMLTSFDYCSRKNVRIVQPYLLYYAALSCCRALIFTRPDFQIQTNDFYEMSHTKIINILESHLASVFPKSGAGFSVLLSQLRFDRELFSYRFPAQGIARSTMNGQFKRVADLCSLLSENAQLNSECLEASIKRNVTGRFGLNPAIVKRCFVYGEGPEAIDDDDYYRTDYMARAEYTPCNLRTMASEGLVEDYFGSWFPEDEEGDPYDPDRDTQIIFPFD